MRTSTTIGRQSFNFTRDSTDFQTTSAGTHGPTARGDLAHRYRTRCHLFSAGERIVSPAEYTEEDLGSLEDDPTPKLQRVEAVLFLSRDGISSRKLARLAGLADATEARTLIRELNDSYDRQGCAFRVEDVAGGYVVFTRSQFATWLNKLGHTAVQRKLSQTAMETLSIVAYRQPVLRAEIEAIRGVSCSELLKQLMELDLVRISGRSEDLGRPYLYGTTRRFLQMFGLRSVDRLPRMAWVNEPHSEHAVTDPTERQLEAEDSTMTYSVKESTELEEDQASNEIIDPSTSSPRPNSKGAAAEIEDDEDGWGEAEDADYDDDEEEDSDSDSEDGELEDDDWDEDDDEEEVDEEESEWQEVGDDDDGWVEEDDDESDDDDEEDWGEEEEEEGETWD